MNPASQKLFESRQRDNGAFNTIYIESTSQTLFEKVCLSWPGDCFSGLCDRRYRLSRDYVTHTSVWDS